VIVGAVAFDTVGLVERLPEPETTARVDRVDVRCGGTAGNVAVGLARLGERVELVSAVGPDFAGSAYEARLRSLGVDLGGLARVAAPTSHAYVWTAADGRQMTYFHPGASLALGKAPVREASLAHFSAGEISDYPRRMRAAEQVTFDPGQECHHRALGEIEACLPLVDILFVNERERERLERGIGLTAQKAWEIGLDALVVTHGAKGTEVLTPKGTERVPVAPARVLDPTGGGDAHRAGFLLGLARGLPLAACARLGSVAAAATIEVVGSQEAETDLGAIRARHEAAYGPCPV